tara:strand:+ start:5042 stop:5248 length:207 start_codon:yes stop_codon:yes gene_type:complete
LRTLSVLIAFVFLFSCKTEENTNSKEEVLDKEVNKHDVFTCPMECENGMTYYIEGKCDICHINLVKQE